MAEPWKVKPVDDNNEDTFVRIGYSDVFTIDDVLSNFDYYRGYLKKQEDSNVTPNNLDETLQTVINFDYGKREPLGPLKTGSSSSALNYDDVITHWNYALPEDTSELKQCMNRVEQLSSRVQELNQALTISLQQNEMLLYDRFVEEN